VALSESCFQKGVGASVRLASGDLPIECILFGEDASRVVLSCDPKQVKRIQQIAVQHGISSELMGETVMKTLDIFVDGKIAVSAPVETLRADFEGSLEKALGSDPAAMAAD
jgi:phosphoribosylformylglycinamidine (FGAM) synthase-like enzyme